MPTERRTPDKNTLAIQANFETMLFSEGKGRILEQQTTPSEPTVVLTPNAAVIKLGQLPPIDEPLPTIAKLDRSVYKVLELEDDDAIFYGNHSFLNSMLQSFKMHKSITLSPDIIWLLIVQGFCYHVAANAEKLRSQLVSFNGKEELTVTRLDLMPESATKDDWTDIVNAFVEQVGKKTKDHIALTLEPKFSTTTPCSHTSGMVSIMSTMKHYFDYRVIMAGCGFPSITIEGTAEDWVLIKEKTQILSKYGLEWWTSELIPIINQFIKARKGTPDYSFWNGMVRINGGKDAYDPSFIDGWICALFPYNRFGYRNSLTKLYKISDLPSEILDTPFILELRSFDGETVLGRINSQFDSGFFGAKETKEGPGLFNVKPVIGWGVKTDVPCKDA